MDTKYKTEKRDRRRKRIRSKISGTAESPRLSVFKSNTAIYAQLIDDEAMKTLASADTRSASGKKLKLTEKAKEVGKAIAAKALGLKISKAVFDRGGYIFTGAVKALAEGAREGGLKF